MTDDLSWIDHPANLRANAVLLRAVADQSLLHADEIERLRAAAKPFAEWGWYDAELEDDNCTLVRHSGPITVGHWRALRAALGMKP